MDKLNFTQENEAFCMLFDSALSMFTMIAVKNHMEYFSLRCKIQLDHPVFYPGGPYCALRPNNAIWAGCNSLLVGLLWPPRGKACCVGRRTDRCGLSWPSFSYILNTYMLLAFCWSWSPPMDQAPAGASSPTMQLEMEEWVGLEKVKGSIGTMTRIIILGYSFIM